MAWVGDGGPELLRTSHFFHRAEGRKKGAKQRRTAEKKGKWKKREKQEKIFKSVSQNIAEGKLGKMRDDEREAQKQIHLKSFVIKSKLTFRTKLCYPPNLHFSLTNTESNERDKGNEDERTKCLRHLTHR